MIGAVAAGVAAEAEVEAGGAEAEGHGCRPEVQPQRRRCSTCSCCLLPMEAAAPDEMGGEVLCRSECWAVAEKVHEGEAEDGRGRASETVDEGDGWADA